MKSNIFIYQYDKNKTSGTNSAKEFRNYFSSKMIDIEDDIIINDISIQYADVLSKDNNNGFQYLKYDNVKETIQLKNLSDLKYENTIVELQSQSELDLVNNTKWYFRINCKKILEDYLYLRLKENRVFKCIYYDNLNNIDINTFIKNYIQLNVLNRYEFKKVDFYIKYIDLLGNNNIYTNTSVKYNPIFDKNIINDEYLIKNVNINQLNNILYLDDMKILYNQVKKSSQYKINYYYNLYFTKI